MSQKPKSLLVLFFYFSYLAGPDQEYTKISMDRFEGGWSEIENTGRECSEAYLKTND